MLPTKKVNFEPWCTRMTQNTLFVILHVASACNKKDLGCQFNYETFSSPNFLYLIYHDNVQGESLNTLLLLPPSIEEFMDSTR